MTLDSIEGYRAFLSRRDGEPDPYRQTLSARERFFGRIDGEPVRSKVTFDRDVFLRELRRQRIDPSLDPKLRWLLACALGNQAERFGVELSRVYGRGPAEGDPPEKIHVALQESYHTRILADVVALFGLPTPQQAPPRAIRAAIRWMVFSPLPERMNLPIIGASEMRGCVFFRLLRDRGLELFADEPRVRDRIGQLFDEILADEICHVGLIEAKLGRFGRAVMHALFREIAAGELRNERSDLSAAVGHRAVIRAYEHDFDLAKLTAEYPETAYAFGDGSVFSGASRTAA